MSFGVFQLTFLKKGQVKQYSNRNNCNDSKLLNGEKLSTNWYGGKIIDFDEKRIAPGDFIVIPAMTGHQYIPDKNDTLIYCTIKLKRVK